MTKTLSAIIMGGAALMAFGPAMAQQKAPEAASVNMFARDRNVSVSERPRPGYDALPISMGGFTGLPRLEAGVESNDNVYASSTTKNSDTVFTVNPEFDLASRWSRNALQAYVRSATRQYSNYTNESTTDWQLGGAGRLDVGSYGSIIAGGDTGYFTEPRTSPNNTFQTARPVRYAQSNAYVGGIQEFNRVRLSVRYDYSTYDYRNNATPAGAFFLEDDRDHDTSTVSGKAEYAVSPATAVFIDAAYNDHHYRLQPPTVAINKNSQGSTVSAGVNFDLTHVARGEVEVGYLNQTYSAAKVSSTGGLSAKAMVEWFPTQLTTVTLNGSRGVQDSAAVGAPTYTAGVIGLQADHELLRNVILTGRIGTENDDYNGTDRHDKNLSGSIGAKYLLSRIVGLTVSYQYLKQDSSGANKGPHYTDNLIKASTNLQF
jgi:hypothetical protein